MDNFLRLKKTRILVRSTRAEAFRTIQYLNPAGSENVRMVRKFQNCMQCQKLKELESSYGLFKAFQLVHYQDSTHTFGRHLLTVRPPHNCLIEIRNVLRTSGTPYQVTPHFSSVIDSKHNSGSLISKNIFQALFLFFLPGLAKL